ncbi:Transposase IS116/IS110/IS902 family protein [Rubripirellula obstinata]|uniref:Transposase IS116/IS110/IS902 family protein n=1 Tax=Rubripirellula obstinata TaxID=406547 RepID=A0A5B1CNI0_9BACT|nr:IS110 family transposase [Rubripirellula obstinata]KAA1262096.1 Transposase IS116/IS110/IS902 family protein [Rubripirellula obstinata]
MSNVIMIGCDLHDRNMLLRYAVGTAEPQQLAYDNDAAGRRRMIARLKAIAEKNQAEKIIFAYEASGLGHGLSDELHQEGIECFVLSPTHLPKTPKSARLKTDAKDAQMLLEQLRGFVLAGNDLPVVWTPPQRLRDDRELVRARVDVADEMTRVKLKINTLLKLHQLKVVSPTKCKWTKAFVTWIREKLIPDLDLCVATKLKLLLDRFDMYRKEQGELDKALKKLSREPRYKVACNELRKLPGVGQLVALTFLTEMGDLERFANRRQIAAYMGLCPSSNESGEKNDRKGRITRQGPARLRKVLCQAAWVSVNRSEEAAADYHRIKQGQKHRSKKALVAMMRKLGIKMWHRALACGVSSELKGRDRPSSKDFVGLAQSGLAQRTVSAPSLQLGQCAG